MKILLLGAQGQLGQTFLSDGGLAARGDLVAGSREGTAAPGARGALADLSDSAALEALLHSERPDVIVNAAAYTAVDKAEGDEALATQVNGDAVGVLGRWAAAHGALVVHFSTDYVFAGDSPTPYAADDATDPQGAYGRSKLAGEIALRESGARHFLFRTAWVYSPVGHNFLKTMLRLGAERDELSVVADQHGTPTTAALIVAGTLAALDAYTAANDGALTGTYHLTASGETTWHGFADALFDDAVEAGVLARRPVVRAISTDQFPTPARRPAYSVLNNRSFVQAFGHALPDWREGLRDTIRALRAS
ncbi:dTDP-4-dehydrorhamnose reductase [Luteibacter pinisoli]|uniref:dTDP-4-dehydrorhamnose reductase n=1 Tax=Luteibacter pinisoli TaxID=2589080 RepID=A0A4Y5Z1I2_9GAMM|nr:dTDP-4-dehydrorhamnose reductase [Luteibacter pinisoli]QDE38489.1 dTDP-4-dehydrorhamnose reductase [Luteibacter pinisoli]